MKPSLVFHCPDVEDTCEKLAEKGVEIKMKPSKMPWGTFATILDQDGNELGLTTQELA